MSNDKFRRDVEWIRILILLDRIYRIDGIFFARGEDLFGRRPLYPDDPDDPVDPVQLLSKDNNPSILHYWL
jgi:hypothetical protein